MFNKYLEVTINQAFNYARVHRHEFITVEHILLALLDNNETMQLLVNCGASIERLRSGISIFLDETTPHLPENQSRDIQPTMSFQRVIQRSIYQTQTSGANEVTGIHVLMAIFGEPESQALYFLAQEKITKLDIVRQANTLFKQDNMELEIEQEHQELSIDKQELSEEDNLLAKYTSNMNEYALCGRYDPLIGRHHELERCIQVLCRRTKNNPIFVGEAGVGKTSMIEGLVQRLVGGFVPQKIKNSTIYNLDLGALLAGTKYRGDFEKRFKSVLKILSKRSGAIVFIDEIHNLVGAGSATGGTMDAANLIKPLLSSGELRCIGATTYDEYRNFIAKDNALMRRFQKIDLAEPSVNETIKILNGLKSRFEEYHNLEYTELAIRRAVVLSDRYINNRQLPDKAIDVIDEAGALQHTIEGKAIKKIQEGDIDQAVAKITRIPIDKIGQSDKRLLKRLDATLKEQVFGQDQAIETICETIKLSRAGIGDIRKPIGSFLFAGPTGVGKTELTRALSNEMGIKLLRFDMSEYMEKHTVSRLIGSPPGYVGYEQGGLLTEAVIKNPHAVLLLDEIEKAHPDIFNILLQVMDYGTLTDNNGRVADFRHVIIVLTTNAGAAALEKQKIGFSRTDESTADYAALNQLFSPEFRNRLDNIIPFAHLTEDIMLKVVNKFIAELKNQLKERNVTITLSTSAKKWLAKQGYDRHMGARPMARIIQQYIKKPLAHELLFGKAQRKGIAINIQLDNNIPTICVSTEEETT